MNINNFTTKNIESTKLLLISFISILIFVSCRPLDYVRNVEVIRRYFYPHVYQRKGLGEDTPGAVFDHSYYGLLLDKFVDDKGIVDYKGIAEKQVLLDTYINSISYVNLEGLSRYEQLALLLNSYNAFTLKLIIENPGIKSIKDIPSKKRWDDKRWDIGGNLVTLDEIEHNLIRKVYGESLIHFALVCASKGCPKFRNEPYTGKKLVAQLNDQAAVFFSKDTNFRWSKDKNTVYYSELLDWFRNDFADEEMGLVTYSLTYLDLNTASEISEAEDLKIKYLAYDWSLNGVWD